MNNYNIDEHTVEHYRKKPQTVKDSIKRLEAEKNKSELRILYLKQWKYIAHCLGLDMKEKVIFS